MGVGVFAGFMAATLIASGRASGGLIVLAALCLIAAATMLIAGWKLVTERNRLVNEDERS